MIYIQIIDQRARIVWEHLQKPISLVSTWIIFKKFLEDEIEDYEEPGLVEEFLMGLNIAVYLKHSMLLFKGL